MRIAPQQPVFCNNCSIVQPCRRHNHLIRRIGMKRLRKRCRTREDLEVQRNDVQTRHVQGRCRPLLEILKQPNTILLNKLADLPDRNGRKEELSIPSPLEYSGRLFGQLLRKCVHPDPSVCIQKIPHWHAFQSSEPNGATISSKISIDPLSLPSSIAPRFSTGSTRTSGLPRRVITSSSPLVATVSRSLRA